MTEKELRIPLDAGVQLAGDLNEFVVAFDRIFSRMAFGGGDSELLVQYLIDRDVRSRIAKAREVVFDALETVIGEEAAEAVAENGYRHFDLGH